MRKPVWCLVAVACMASGCFSFYGKDAGGQIELHRSALHSYMEKAELARPELVQRAMTALRSGKRYRDRVIDQKNRWTLATIWIDRGRQNTLNIVTSRDETCPKCGGKGKRKWTNETMQNMPFDTRCLTCDGKGFLPHHTMERQYVLSTMDFASAPGGPASTAKVLQAPPEVQPHIARLASEDPAERLQGCQWLDRYYVKKGRHFQEVMPMLRKARWQEASAEKRLMVWQFHAGKGLTGEYARAYYRIYADQRSGKIVQKGFYPEQ